MNEAGKQRDPGLPATAARCREIAAVLGELITPGLIDEHRRAPSGPHSPALALVLAHLRQAPVAGKLVAYASVPGREWRIMRLSGEQGVPPDASDPEVFGSEADVVHEIFLRRLGDLGLHIDRGEAAGG